MADIFICYRRKDSEGHAGRLSDPLMDRFGKRAVFIDVDNLHPGVDFDQVIQSTLLRSKVVLVVIGPRWLDSRLKDEDDYVRKEILAALKAKKRLIPVLVEGARMPSPEKLPPELAALAGKNAVILHHPTWRTDVSRLITSLERYLARAKAGAAKAGPSRAKGKPAPRKKAAPDAKGGSPPAKKAPAKRAKAASGSPDAKSALAKESARAGTDPLPRAPRPRKPAAAKGAGAPAGKSAKPSGPRKTAAKAPKQPSGPQRPGRRPAGKNTPKGTGRRPG